MNVDDFAEQVAVIRNVVDEPRSAGKIASRWLSVVGVVLEELDVAIEELRDQNDELRLNQHLIGRETEHYREMFDLAPDSYLVSNELGIIMEANRKACDSLNVSLTSLEGKPLSVFVDPADRRAFRRLLRESLDGRSAQTLEIRMQPRAQLPFDAEVSVQASSSRSDESTVVRWAVRDITRRNRRLTEMQAMNTALPERVDAKAHELRDLLTITDEREAIGSNMTADGVEPRDRLAAIAATFEALSSSVDPRQSLDVLLSATIPAIGDWAVTALVCENGSLVEVAASHRDPDIADRLGSALSADDFTAGSLLSCGHAVLNSGLPQFSPKGEPFSADTDNIEILTWMSDNTADLSVMAVPLRSRGDVIGVLEIGRDSTRSSFDSDDLAFALELTGPSSLAVDNARLLERSQVADAARDDFLSVAAHELRTPITVVRGYAQILARRFSGERAIEPARAVRMAREIEKQTDHLAAIVETLVDVSRAASRQLALGRATVELSEIVSNQVETARLTTERHRFVTAVEPGIMAMVDAVRFEQVVASLLDNAVKFSLEGGPITVSLERASDRLIRFTVRDHGMGVDPAHRTRIFERFYQAHGRADIRGLGLGLFISREIMHLHGGDLRAEFPSNGDTVFVAELPVSNPQPV